MALLSIACEPQENSKNFTVGHAGALKNFMHKGDLSARADLRDFKDSTHLYALGAIENLKGEILIWDSEPIISMERDSAVFIDQTLDHKAALLVYTNVDQWEAIDLPDSLGDYAELESFVAQAAINQGLDTALPFPFLLKGEIATLNWHIINWPEGDTQHTHDKHRTSGPHGKLQNQTVEVLGFYSNHHHAIFTHHSTNMHMHVKTQDGKLAGHVDQLKPSRSITLYLPG
jgi:acetolactate decarboxylase